MVERLKPVVTGSGLGPLRGATERRPKERVYEKGKRTPTLHGFSAMQLANRDPFSALEMVGGCLGIGPACGFCRAFARSGPSAKSP
jgi:hypothetical protein